MNGIEAMIKARDILNRARVPLDHNGAWMSKDTFIGLGGSQQAWEKRFGDETTAYVTQDGHE